MPPKLNKVYTSFIGELKNSIVKSRYQAARLANKEQLLLYLHIGKRLSEKIESEKWGSKVIEQIASDLQSELPGLRGFSVTSLKKMRQFSHEYYSIFQIGPSATVQLKKSKNSSIRPSATVQLKNNSKTLIKSANKEFVIGQPLTNEIKKNGKIINQQQTVNSFFNISFTHHILLLNKCKELQERLFYMQLAATDFWSVSLLEHHIHAKLYRKQGKLPNNFKSTLPSQISTKALNVFKDEYLFDFMLPDEYETERVFEDTVVANIRKFILSLGKGFSFIGNQYKLDVDGQEFFIDLLFYNRILQCLVVFELKRGKFKPSDAGQLNFYLNVLDDKVKLPNENPSIGIILCKQKNNAIVEFAFKNISKAMGVATYKLSNKLPKELKGILPDAETLKKLL